MNETVSITYDRNQPALVVPTTEAQELYDKYKALTLEHPEDFALFRTLTVALGILPPPRLHYGEGEPALAARTLDQWKAVYGNQQ